MSTSSIIATSTASVESKGLSGAAIGGIVGGLIGGLVLFGLGISVGFLIYRREKNDPSVYEFQETTSNDPQIPERPSARTADTDTYTQSLSGENLGGRLGGLQ